jgi:4-diphosphocytidyl-2-C-methyl-D-erythritol kinase
MDKLSLPAPAKLNLFLKLIGQREDGYHLLQTVFQLLDYGDTLDFTLRNDDKILLHNGLPGVKDSDNLIVRAAMLLKEQYDCSLGAEISLQKQLPMGGGIGGGSSDAATTLLALNQLWSIDLSLSQLAELGLQLGADVPVFVHGQTAWAEGIGEQLQAIDIPETWYLVIKPDCQVSTGEIFSHKQLTRNSSPITMASVFEQGASNDCQAIVCELYPKVASTLQWLDQYSPAQLTGTGACVFARFDNKAAATEVLAQLSSPSTGFIARGVSQSPAHRALAQQKS